MAVFRCTVFISPPPLLPTKFSVRRFSLKFIQCSSASPTFPSRSSKRKNYLRPKILRTLKPKPSETSSIEIETPQIALPSDELSYQIRGEEELQVPSDELSYQIGGEEELQVPSYSVVSDEHNGISGKLSPKSVAKYGLYVVGVFVFQTVCAVWFLGNSTHSDKTPEISNHHGSSNRRISLNGSGKFSSEVNGLKPSNMIYLDEFEMDEKIAEIQAMAREARKSEQKGDKNEQDETVSSTGRFDIEKEIDTRLSNMEKRLNSQRKGLAGLRVGPLDEFGNGGGKRSDLKIEGNEKDLMFEKKYKFKADKQSSNGKGFGGSRDNKERNSRMKETDKSKSRLNGKVNELPNDDKISKELEKEEGAADPEIIPGAVQEINQRRSSNVAKKSRNSLPSERKERKRQSDKENGLWWLKLPYVLRILMRSSIDEEISEGYFTLRTNATEEDESESSHIVAFEDQNDARNFCYLLESVFEDLDGFSTDIIPTSTKDLHNEVSSGGKKVMVIKKKQLRLYAGQPFEEVERALHSLIKDQQWK